MDNLPDPKDLVEVLPDVSQLVPINTPTVNNPIASKPSIASDAWKNAKDTASALAGFAKFSGDNTFYKIGKGMVNSVKQGTEFSDLGNLAKNTYGVFKKDITDITNPIIDNGYKGIPESAGNVLRRPFDYAQYIIPFLKTEALAGPLTRAELKTAEVVGDVGSSMAQKAAERVVSSKIKPRNADYLFGKNPERAVVNEGIVAPSIKALHEEIVAKKDEVGRMYEPILNSPENASKKITVPLSDVIGPLDKSFTELAANTETNMPYMKNLLSKSRDLLMIRDEYGNIVRSPNIIRNMGGDVVRTDTGDTIGIRHFRDMTPTQVNDLKKQIYQITNYATDDTSAGRKSADIANSALRQSANNVKNILNKNVPEIAPINERYADLVGAEKAARHRARIVGRSDIFSLSSDIAGASMGAAMAHGGVGGRFLGALAGLIGGEILSGTPARTVGAQIIKQGIEKPVGSLSEMAKFLKPATVELSRANNTILKTGSVLSSAERIRKQKEEELRNKYKSRILGQ